MTISNAINNVQFTSVNIVTFTSNGTYTPPANLLWAEVVCTGGGGGSGGCATTGVNQGAVSGAGGGGAVVRQVYARASLAPNVLVTIGAAGTGGSAGNNAGTSGGNTTFLTLSAGGGNGSAGGPAALSPQVLPANGGTASGGAVNINGPIGITSGLINTNPHVPLYGIRAYTITGFGTGADSRIIGPNTGAVSGNSGGSGQITITEFLAS